MGKKCEITTKFRCASIITHELESIEILEPIVQLRLVAPVLVIRRNYVRP